jgi:hypothetical protein
MYIGGRRIQRENTTGGYIVTREFNVRTVHLVLFGIHTEKHKRYIYEGGPKNNRNLNVARELEVIARCAARCR